MSASIRSGLSLTALLASMLPSLAQGAPLVPAAEIATGVTMEVTELKRLTDKNATQLKFTIANAGASPTSAKALGFATSYRLEEIQLIDFAGKRAFNIGMASKCLCSTFTDGGTIAPGAKREFWAWFGLPDPGVKVVSIQIGDKPPIADVPLQ